MRGGRRKAYCSEKLELERIEAERIRLAKIEAERLEKERLARLERERLEQIRVAKKLKIESEVIIKQKKYDRDLAHWTALGVEYQRLWNEYLAFDEQYPNAGYKPACYQRWSKDTGEYNNLSPIIKKQEQELERLKAELARLK